MVNMKTKLYFEEQQLCLSCDIKIHDGGGEWMGKELEIEKPEVKLNPVTDGDIAILNFVVNCIRQIESTLDVKKNEIEIKKKYTR